jgi:hypothetical protein
MTIESGPAKDFCELADSPDEIQGDGGVDWDDPCLANWTLGLVDDDNQGIPTGTSEYPIGEKRL